MTQLSGKVALVTGASSGLGAAVAQVFAERGASVYGIARDTERMGTVFESVPGGEFASVDIASAQACRDAVAGCVERFGRLDLLFNNAGTGAPPVPIEDHDLEGSLAVEPVMDVQAVADAVLLMARLPLDANVQFMTIAATKMPFIGRG